MGLITNYGELKSEVASWLDREDLTDKIPGMIKLAESRIYRKLRTQDNEFLVQLTQTDDPVNPIPLPENFRAMKLLTVNDLPLDPITDLEFRQRKRRNVSEWNLRDTMWYTIISRQLYLFPWPDATPDDWGEIAVDISYWGTESIGEMATWDTPTNPNQIPEQPGTAPATTERGDTATTRLLQVAPDVYLFGALTMAHGFLREDKRIPLWKSQFEEVLAQLEAEGDMDELSGGVNAVSSVYHDSPRRAAR